MNEYIMDALLSAIIGREMGLSPEDDVIDVEYKEIPIEKGDE